MGAKYRKVREYTCSIIDLSLVHVQLLSMNLAGVLRAVELLLGRSANLLQSESSVSESEMY